MDEGRSRGNAPKGCNREGGEPQRRFCIHNVSSAEKGWGSETCNKSEKTERLCENGTFQNGGNPYVKVSPQRRRLDGQNRPERRVLCSTDSSRGSEIPQVQVEERNISIYLPSVWSVMCSLGVYQDNESNDSVPTSPRAKDDHLHRRHSAPSEGRENPSGTCRSTAFPSEKPRLHNKPEEILLNTSEKNRIPGFCGGLNVPATECARPKDQRHQNSGGETENMSERHSARLVEIPRETKCRESGSDSSTSVLQTPSGSPESCTEYLGPRLLVGDTTNACRMGRTGLVDSTPIILERKELDCSQTTNDYRDRRIPDRLGGVLQRKPDRRSLDERGAEPPYKLPRITGGKPSCTNICQDSIRNNHPAENGQCVSPDLHKQDGRYALQNSYQHDQTTMDVVPGEGHQPDSSVPTRIPECDCGCRITMYDRQIRLATLPRGLSEDQQSAGSDRSRPIRLSPDKTGGEVRELETGSMGNSPGRLHSRLESTQRLCQSPLELDRKGVSVYTGTENPSDSCGSRLEIPGLVSDPTGDAREVPPPDPTTGGPIPGQPSVGNAGNTATTGRVAYLRNRYREHELSEEASDLLLASWREKSGRTYDSLFGKWVSWCDKRNSDPISGPVSEVVNFLTELFEQGYQYRSINNYRSAISSAHDLVDGRNIGQHPLVCRLLKGVFNKRPPLPRYSDTWKVDTVTDYIKSLPPNSQLSLSALTGKTLVLMALVRPSRSADLAKLKVSARRDSPEGISFMPEALAKQSRPGRQIVDYYDQTA